jgi:hypothetical protein
MKVNYFGYTSKNSDYPNRVIFYLAYYYQELSLEYSITTSTTTITTCT